MGRVLSHHSWIVRSKEFFFVCLSNETTIPTKNWIYLICRFRSKIDLQKVSCDVSYCSSSILVSCCIATLQSALFNLINFREHVIIPTIDPIPEMVEDQRMRLNELLDCSLVKYDLSWTIWASDPESNHQLLLLRGMPSVRTMLTKAVPCRWCDLGLLAAWRFSADVGTVCSRTLEDFQDWSVVVRHWHWNWPVALDMLICGADPIACKVRRCNWERPVFLCSCSWNFGKDSLSCLLCYCCCCFGGYFCCYICWYCSCWYCCCFVCCCYICCYSVVVGGFVVTRWWVVELSI